MPVICFLLSVYCLYGSSACICSPACLAMEPHSSSCVACPAEGSNNRPVWTPSASQGQPFPAKRVSVEVWGIGAFKFKNIQGISKVSGLSPLSIFCSSLDIHAMQPWLSFADDMPCLCQHTSQQVLERHSDASWLLCH